MAAIVGREVEVVETIDKQFIVLFMNFTTPPPPKGKTPEEALINFLNKVKGDTDYASRIGPIL